MTRPTPIPSPSVRLRQWAADAQARAEALLYQAFAAEVEAALAELDDDVDDEPPTVDDLWAEVADERRRLLLFYLPALLRIAGDLQAVAGDALAQFVRGGGVGAQRQALDRLAKGVEGRLAQLYDGLAWAGAELARAAVAERRGMGIYWNLDPSADHCALCPVLAAGSPYASINEIGGVPGGDLTPCKARCRCYLTYGSAD